MGGSLLLLAGSTSSGEICSLIRLGNVSMTSWGIWCTMLGRRRVFHGFGNLPRGRGAMKEGSLKVTHFRGLKLRRTQRGAELEKTVPEATLVSGANSPL